MLATEIIREIIKECGLGVNEYSRRLGKSPRLVSDRLHHPNISIEKLQEMLRVLDYKILIVPSDRRVREGEYEVTVSGQKEEKSKTIDLDAILGTSGKIKLVDTPKPEGESEL